jgi:Leucine-rich repeat (LRR) protein
MKRDDIKSLLKTKQQIEKNRNLVQPTAIDEKLIMDYMVAYHKEEKVYDMEHMKTWDLTHLSLSYSNILEIDNLHGMTNLKELRLDNNIITRIQGLDDLVNLEWLDLSFNLIEKIEGLEFLTKLTDLSLYKNRIGVLAGLDNLHQLEVLSIGCNKL